MTHTTFLFSTNGNTMFIMVYVLEILAIAYLLSEVGHVSESAFVLGLVEDLYQPMFI